MWVTIILWLLSFLLAGGTKSGQAGKAAMIATGVAAAGYYTIEPTNPDALFGDASREFFGYTANPDPAVATASGATGPKPTAYPGIGSQAISTAGDVLKSWGPAGTVGVIGGAAAVTGSGIFKDIPPWLLIGGALLLIMR